jgi:peptide deformylase
MAILKIARMGHPILRVRAEEIDDPMAPEVQRLVPHMLETMVDADGLGLAAPQIYVSKRLVIFSIPADRADEFGGEVVPMSVLINPMIEPMSDEMVTGWEGCLSVPGLRGQVARHTHVGYRGLSLKGKPIEREAKGWHARVVQHEFDHLDGILYPQRMDDLGELVFESEIKHLVEDPEERAAVERAD